MKNDPGILDSMSTSVLALNGALQVTALNSAGEALLETSKARCIGQHASVLVLEPSEWLEHLQQAATSKTTRASRSLTLCLHSGHKILVDLVITPVTEETSSSLLVELTAVDRLLRISRVGNYHHTQETSRAVIRGLAHEIKNPLGGLRGAAQLLARELPNEELAEYTHVIIREADRLRDLVDRLLGPTRELNKQNLNIHEILEHVRNLITAESENRIMILRDYDPSLPEFEFDRAQLIQLVLNIMRNAMQAAVSLQACEITLRSRAQRQFTISGTLHRLVCGIEVIDNGPGIAPDIMPSIFAPMVTGRAHGTGLGLSIAQSIAHMHDGTIECDSRPGETRFTLYLPMDKTHEQPN